MSDMEMGLSAAIALLVAVLAFFMGRRTNKSQAVPVAKPSETQVDVEQKVQILVEKARAAKEQAQKMAGKEREEALVAHQKQLEDGVNALADSPDELNEYLRQVGNDIRRS